MSILSKFFGKNAIERNPVTVMMENANKNEVLISGQIPPVDLFVDNQPPQNEIINSEQIPNKLNQFLKRDYLSIGFNDGYEYHSNETLDSGKRRIKADFLLIMDQSIEEKQIERLKTKNLLVDVQKVSEDASKKLENMIEELNLSINSLQRQKELSIDNEGWVMTAIHSYHFGFRKGIDDFIAGEELLNSIKNI